MNLSMKPLAAVLGLAAACAACCAIPILFPAVLALAGVTAASLGAPTVAAGIVAAAASLLGVALWQRVRRKEAAAKKSCSCETSCEAGASKPG